MVRVLCHLAYDWPSVEWQGVYGNMKECIGKTNTKPKTDNARPQSCIVRSLWHMVLVLGFVLVLGMPTIVCNIAMKL